MKANWIGKIFIVGGLLLLAAALWLTMANIREQTAAANAAASVLEQMEALKEQPALPEATEAVHGTTGPASELVVPDYIRDPEMPMPEVKIQGYSYIGTVTIPSLELSLPVISQWSYPRLQVAPCRYLGSAYTNDLIIMAHNYPKHFGTLSKLQLEEEVFFEDMAGNVFRYQVVDKETLDSYSGEEMISGDWDLTLFTCTVGGKSRVTIRCEQVSS